MNSSQQFQQTLKTKSYRILTNIQNNTLRIMVELVFGKARIVLKGQIHKKGSDSKQDWDLNAIQKHLSFAQNSKFCLEDYTLSIFLRTNIFGRTLQFQAFRIQLMQGEYQNQRIMEKKQQQQHLGFQRYSQPQTQHFIPNNEKPRLKMESLPSKGISIQRGVEQKNESKILPQEKIEAGEQNLFKQQQSCQKLKKCILVVGRMGHGKTSFTNTLILPKNYLDKEIPEHLKDKMLQAGAKMKSITVQCKIYKVNDSHQLFSQDLYIIDTPGLNSQDSVCLVSQQIDNIIIAQKCQIIGIAYVINLGADRQISGNGSSTIIQFMKLLKMKNSIKNDLVFFVLSNWDALYFKFKQQELNKCYQQFKEFIKKSINKEKIIRWASSHCSKKKNYDFFIQQGGKDLVQSQWKQMRNIIKKQCITSLKLEMHIKNTQTFWDTLVSKILKEIKNDTISYKEQYQNFQYQKQINMQIKKGFQKTSGFFKTTFAEGAVTTILGVATIEFGVGLIYLPVGLGKMGFSTIGLGITGLMSSLFGKKQKIEVTNKSKQNFEQQYKRIMKQMLIKQISQKLKISIIKQIEQVIKITDDKIIIERTDNLSKVSKICLYYYYANTRIRIAQINNNQFAKKHQIKITIQEDDQLNDSTEIRIPGKKIIYAKTNADKLRFQIQFSCRLPRQQNYYHMIKSECVKMFGDYQ